MKILARTEANDPQSLTGIEFHRQYMPFQYMGQVNGVSSVYAHNPAKQQEEGAINIQDFNLYHVVRKDVIVKQNKWTDAGTINYAKENGLPIVVDFDDLWRLDSTHALYNYYKQQDVERMSIHWISQADHVTTTTQRLADHIRKYNSNVTVIPNALHPIVDQFAWSEPYKYPNDRVTLGWVGSIHHLNDIKILQDFFTKLWNNQYKNMDVLMGGYNSHPIHDQIARIMSGDTVIGRSRLKTLEAMPAIAYAKMYQYIDIALAPLADNEFNRCKSELKLIEAGHFGIPVIASDVYPYNTVIEHGHNGFLIKNTLKDVGKVWLKYANELIHDDVLRFHMGQNLKKTINQRFNIADSNNIRYNLYRELCK